MNAVTPHLCHICNGTLLPLSDFSALVQVTSDCRPWHSGGTLTACSQCGTVQKPTTVTWRKEADEIYAEYAIYTQGGGAEQATFDASSGEATARSQKIVAWLSASGQLPTAGKLLDIGCGNGAFLRAFSTRYPGWQLTGLELNDRNRTIVEAIPEVTQLHVGPLNTLDDRFDVIVLIHALEHIPEPARYLKSLADLLNPGGRLLIEVPDLEESPFDILIADHTTHFTATTLQRVMQDAGFVSLSLARGFVPKELTLLAEHRPDTASMPQIAGDSARDRDIAIAHVSWLLTLLDRAQAVQTDYAIFGTSISATWMAASMQRQVSFFIDEDMNRVGGSHMGRRIYHPNDMPPVPTVLLPLRGDIAKAIAGRFARLQCQFIFSSIGD